MMSELKPKIKSRIVNQIPAEILNNEQLNAAIAKLPINYSFEIHKTIYGIQKAKATRVALQFPEGLLLYACLISDILESFAHVETLIMGDVTYGACCIDDFTARALKCDFMVHYGHSCLVPVNITLIKTLYVFVDIGIDVAHFVSTVCHNFADADNTIQLEGFTTKRSVALVSTIQFSSSLQNELDVVFDVIVPQSKPLSQGEILGCTAPKVSSDLIIYIGDGRFHLEAMMISNPHIPAYKYDPYTKKLTIEEYHHDRMVSTRKQQVNEARSAKTIGVILGTLGRQGNTAVLDVSEKSNTSNIKHICDTLKSHGKAHTVILLSEIFPAKLALMDLDCYVQIACPRLSIDWGTFFKKPLLTPYEMMVCLGESEWQDDNAYPMDFYAKDSLGFHTPNHKPTDKVDGCKSR